MSKRLYKSNTNKMVDGVCGGIAEYFGIDPTLIRIGWILFCAAGGSGFLELPHPVIDTRFSHRRHHTGAEFLKGYIRIQKPELCHLLKCR